MYVSKHKCTCDKDCVKAIVMSVISILLLLRTNFLSLFNVTVISLEALGCKCPTEGKKLSPSSAGVSNLYTRDDEWLTMVNEICRDVPTGRSPKVRWLWSKAGDSKKKEYE